MAGQIVLAMVIGYLLGSIPCAYLIGRLVKGVDIRKMGGGNMGAVNTMREIGTLPGFGVLFADMAKGALAVLIARELGLHPYWVFAVGLVAVAGHNWPVWLKFRGGQGLATTMGVLLVFSPIPFAISAAILVVAVIFTSNVRLSAVVGFIFLPPLIWAFGGELSVILYSIALPVFCLLKTMPHFRSAVDRAGDEKKGLIVDRDYTPWQTKKKSD
ncbi:MAG: glycerol-3-phosphate 1-O-acyltransferase PlsY [Dehalococcoidia bacterium]|nr:MAG: glycerol-3-phosphate 1-O-acyltransferase PlsY [Dehalococcoidia bacterium]